MKKQREIDGRPRCVRCVYEGDTGQGYRIEVENLAIAVRGPDGRLDWCAAHQPAAKVAS
jgi:hypothetical protein